MPTSESPHHSARRASISCVIIHTTESDSVASTLDWFKRPESNVSAHVVIDRDGTVWRIVPDERAAWHAGKSTLFGASVAGSVNHMSLGVELVGKAAQVDFPVAQLDAAALYVWLACRLYNIPLNCVVGHCHVSPGRKVDPGDGFPWVSFLRAVASWA